MIYYTKEQYEQREKDSISKFDEYSKTIISDYGLYLKDLSEKKSKMLEKLNLAYEKRDKYLNEMLFFIEKEYPQSKEIFLSGLIFNSVETIVNLTLQSRASKIYKELDNLFSNWNKELHHQNPSK